jgi:hypothetical protein
MGFVSIPNPLNFTLYIKAAFLIIAVGFGAYRLGLWIGDGHGYQRRDVEIAKERVRINEQIDGLNAALDEALAKLDAGREQAAADVSKTLTDIPATVRAQCAKACSVPKLTREALEAIQ